MQLSLVCLASILASAGIAAPVPELQPNLAAATATWTIKSFTRTCNAGDTACTYSFGIKTPNPVVTPCSYTVVAAEQASRASYNSVACGNFTISSSWSGQFGSGNGFQTLSVIGNGKIVYPAYTDKQLVNGTTVSPDQSYTPQTSSQG